MIYAIYYTIKYLYEYHAHWNNRSFRQCNQFFFMKIIMNKSVNFKTVVTLPWNQALSIWRCVIWMRWATTQKVTCNFLLVQWSWIRFVYKNPYSNAIQHGVFVSKLHHMSIIRAFVFHLFFLNWTRNLKQVFFKLVRIIAISYRAHISELIENIRR